MAMRSIIYGEVLRRILPTGFQKRVRLEYTHIYNMGTHMKTTIEVSDALLISTKQAAKRSQTTMRALVEEGLRRVLSEHKARVKPAFKLRDASVHGKATLIADPSHWQQFEDGHVATRILKRQK